VSDVFSEGGKDMEKGIEAEKLLSLYMFKCII
jgi:hypothetical protein